ncbi:PP2C family protein-serine/threonine phosphatase [Desulfonatronum thioautotrophicum]|uniref:PP2C family protein-serine/threonine phosphatase n=1 Tax=Desulfonatronum thioautotrophicum TaxID=617001 RepID=UPI0005EBCFFD|nr:fused response regulator/phosphatase [Desulfonatronum thioautotrophicum]
MDSALHDTPLILIIDDDQTNRLILDRILRASGFGTIQADNGTAGREKARQFAPDLILLDIMMPGESGFETLQQLKAEPMTSTTPVIFLSALDDLGSKVKGFELGAVDFVTKPFEPLEVLARVRTNIKVVQAYRIVIAEQAARLRQIGEAQQAMLTKPEDLPEARFAVSYEPILEAGGDYYDVFPVSGGFGYVVADISGHDLKTSFITSGIKTLLRQNTGPLFTPLETLATINKVLHTVLPVGTFLTATYAVINSGRNLLTILSAGHPPAIFLGANGEVEILRTEGDILGPFADIFLNQISRPVVAGDRIFLYTDGLLDAHQGKSGISSTAIRELILACEACHSQPLAACPDQIQRRLATGAEAKDDAVLMVVEV